MLGVRRAARRLSRRGRGIDQKGGLEMKIIRYGYESLESKSSETVGLLPWSLESGTLQKVGAGMMRYCNRRELLGLG